MIDSLVKLKRGRVLEVSTPDATVRVVLSAAHAQVLAAGLRASVGIVEAKNLSRLADLADCLPVESVREPQRKAVQVRLRGKTVKL